ncbi:MAG: tRNA uridine(34) 5-carboxymethylaminomethyl modification radical SAM/GNAT enzyme Elp3 [Candidatus Moranbacteria bacterium]|nr:tRNA uridine(34) 5-carboxymethylaminomethyl modification radical SAM/GNAT enzyme Elp3 [Candidatus Moranbacteria bacterium]
MLKATALNSIMQKAIQNLITQALKEKIFDEEGLKKLKRKTAKKFKVPFPRNEEIRKIYFKLIKNKKIKRSKQFENLIMLKKSRSLSGVSVVAVLTKNHPCQNNCLYCPTETKMPKSYLSNEPAVMRAIRLKFDPYSQTQKRIYVLESNGHDASKIELIIMGGTFSHLPEKYQYWFVLNCFKACNDSLDQKAYPWNLSLKKIKKLLTKEKKKNQNAKHRIVGLTLETRPDTLNLEELLKYRELGSTRVEIGVQSIYDDILRKNNRGHSVKTTIKATKLLKYLGFKINYHIMPGLYGSTPKKDLQMFQSLFKNPHFKPDMLKIYPCVVTENSELYNLYLKKKYKPCTNKSLKKLLVKIKKIVPRYVRITRLIRDIPTNSIIAGPNIPNLRDLLKRENTPCSCIRCREIARNKPQNKKEKIILQRTDYIASKGREIFLEFVGQKTNYLHAFLRLRINDEKNPLKELRNCSIIREVHSYGLATPIGKRIKRSSQHKGYGKKLIREAEKITRKEFKINRIAVIAAEGTKNYYQKFQFKTRQFYMLKNLSD